MTHRSPLRCALHTIRRLASTWQAARVSTSGILPLLTEDIIVGLDEKLYERAMIIELKRRGHDVSIQTSFPVYYRGELIGNLIPDLIVDHAVIVDPKVVSCFTETHVAQMVGYLNITGLDLALLINFKNARLDWKRVLRPQAPGEHDIPDLHR